MSNGYPPELQALLKDYTSEQIQQAVNCRAGCVMCRPKDWGNPLCSNGICKRGLEGAHLTRPSHERVD